MEQGGSGQGCPSVVLEQSPFAVVLLEQNGIIKWINQFVAELWNISAHEAVGQHVAYGLPVDPEEMDPNQPWIRILSEQQVDGLELPVRQPDGAIRWLLCNTSIHYILEKQEQLVVFGLEITQAKLKREQATKVECWKAVKQVAVGLLRETSQSLQQSKSCLELLATYVNDSPDAAKLINATAESQARLYQSFEALYGYIAPVRPQAGHFDLPDVWREAWNLLEPDRESRQLELAEEIQTEEVSCCLDPSRMVLAFRSILSRLLQSSDGPSVLRVICQADELHQEPALQVTIGGDAVDFNHDQLSDLFEPYVEQDGVQHGLELATARRIIEAHGGTVRPIPRADGALISIVLPRSTAESSGSPAAQLH